MSEGLVTVNAEGQRYTATFCIQHGVIIVTSGSFSTRVELHDLHSPQSIARTILKTMVKEGRAAAWLSEPNSKNHEERRGQTPVTQHLAWRTHCVIGKVCEDGHDER